MVKLKLIVLLLMVVVTATAQEKVNHLVYDARYTATTKKGVEERYIVGTDISINDEQVVVRRLKEDKSSYGNFVKIYDIAKRLLIYDYLETHDYLIEEVDSMYRQNEDPKPTGKTKDISGYNCKEYKATGYLVLTTTDWFSTRTKTKAYNYTVWITEDILADEPLWVSTTVFGGLGTFNYKGVVVRVEFEDMDGKYKYVTELKKADVSQKAKEVQIMPWKKPDVGKVILPNLDSMKYTHEGNVAFVERIQELVRRVTAGTKVKARTQALGYMFY